MEVTFLIVKVMTLLRMKCKRRVIIAAMKVSAFYAFGLDNKPTPPIEAFWLLFGHIISSLRFPNDNPDLRKKRINASKRKIYGAHKA